MRALGIPGARKGGRPRVVGVDYTQVAGGVATGTAEVQVAGVVATGVEGKGNSEPSVHDAPSDSEAD